MNVTIGDETLSMHFLKTSRVGRKGRRPYLLTAFLSSN